MKPIILANNQSKKAIILLLLSLFEPLFWFSGKSFNVYKFAFTGAVFELLALPMLIVFLVIAVFNIITLFKDKLIINKALSLLSLVILIITFIILK